MAVWKIQAAFFYGEKKLKEHRFVAITDEYIQYLQKAEPHVMSNKIDERTYHRKYVGIVEKLIGKGEKKEPLTKKELPYTIAMVILDIVAPFLGVAFSMILLKERPSLQFFVALIIMIFSTVLMVKDTIELQHTHEHRHGDLVHTHLHTHSGESEEHGHEYFGGKK